ncbi:hypothetical protein DEU56DRAFT_831761 [Suillus clintonianus]|uniref:uncharacterized protein n=1 Tax=Suillus clintonianus TaxID=1904413 RepID=UPI001B881091|nr:uncharacterized protein DEU56DRAFT_831761 [Suillus clintonianus]KAG2122589.1 hypothetical protein DEU56DRAFT_831761 [Suillus clintonianus]
MRPRSSVAQALVDNGKKPRQPPKKRARKSDVDGNQKKLEAVTSGAKRAKWQPRPGKLAALMNLPMDVLFEVFGHLNPLDILRLARTTKQFRRVLMHRSSMSVWKNARDNVPNMPDCPPFWTEPHYANLAFDPHCHECSAPGVRNVDWRIGRRICAKCSKTCMVDAYPGESIISSLVPSKYGKRGRLLFYRKEVEEVQNILHVLTDPVELEAYREERRAFVKEMETKAKELDAWAASQAKDRSDQLEDARRDRKTAIIERLTEIGWGDEIEHIPYTDDLSHHKLVKQPTRLTDRIWNNIKNDMIKYMEDMRARRLERERKALLIARRRIAIGVLRNYKIARLPFTDVMPEPVDFCSFPEVIEIVNLPTETEVTEASFAEVASRMDDLAQTWRARIHSQLRARVKDNMLLGAKRRGWTERVTPDPHYEEYVESLGVITDVKGKKKEVSPPVPDDDDIDRSIPLATTVFRCKTCTPSIGLPDLSDSDYDDFLGSLGGRRSKSIPLFYPKVIGHCCLTRSRTLPWDYFATDDPNFRIDFPMSTRTKWSSHLLQVDDEASKGARTVVDACGEDPLIATATKMDELDPRLACLDCVKWSQDEVNQAEAPVFTWRSAVQHRMREHRYERRPAKWMRLEGELLEESNRNACEMHEYIHNMFDFPDITQPASTIWLCTHCMDLPQERECHELGKIKNHLLTSHSIEAPVEDRDYYKDYEAPQGRKSDFKLSDSTVNLQMERPSHVPLPGHGFFGIGDDEDDEDDEEDDFFFGNSFFPFF